MLIVSVSFEFKNDGFQRVKDDITNAVENTRNEPGSRVYDWAIDIMNPNRAVIFEVWENQEALDSHFTHPYMDTLVGSLGKANIRGDIISYSAEIYEVTEQRDMGLVLPTN